MAKQGSTAKEGAPALAMLKEVLPEPKSLLRLVGFAFIQCWTLMLFSSSAFSGSSEPGSSPYLHWLASIGSVLCAFAVLWGATRLIPLSRHRLLNFLVGIAMSAGGFLIILGTYSVMPAFASYAGFFVAGAGTAWIFLCWQEYVSTQGAAKAIGAMLASSVAAAVLYLVICLLPIDIASLCCLALPPLAALLLRPGKGTRFYHTNNVFSGTKALLVDIAHDVSPRLMAVCCLVSCAFGCLRSYWPFADFDASFLFAPAISLAAAGIISCAIVVLTRGGGLGGALVAGIVLCAAGVAALIVSRLHVVGVPGALGSCASNAVYYAVWLILLERSQVRKLPVLGLLASLWMANYIGILAGQFIGALAGPDMGAVVGYVAMACLLAAALVYAGIRGGQQPMGLSEETLREPAVSRSDEAALALAARCGLSARETEIMLLWITGHTASYLEEKLFISRNTVKTHLRHIYRKTGVSDRDALLNMVEAQKNSL